VLWQLLASCSNRIRCRKFGRELVLGVHLACLGCVVVVQVSACAVSNQDLGSRKAPGDVLGSRISPPAPAGESGADATSQAVGRRFLDDPDASSYEYVPPVLQGGVTLEEQRQREMRARSTDAEIGNLEGGLGSPLDTELGRIERDLDLESTVPVEKVPSFTAVTKKIKHLFKSRHFEDALTETNYLLEFYPRSPQLLMMKGTLHQKLEQVDLALAAYREAYFIRPHRKLQAQIRYLEFRVAEGERLRRGNGRVEGVVTPEGVEKIETTYPGFDGFDDPASRDEPGVRTGPGVGDLPAGRGN
jgi:hypothetical protein